MGELLLFRLPFESFSANDVSSLICNIRISGKLKSESQSTTCWCVCLLERLLHVVEIHSFASVSPVLCVTTRTVLCIFVGLLRLRLRELTHVVCLLFVVSSVLQDSFFCIARFQSWRNWVLRLWPQTSLTKTIKMVVSEILLDNIVPNIAKIQFQIMKQRNQLWFLTDQDGHQSNEVGDPNSTAT